MTQSTQASSQAHIAARTLHVPHGIVTAHPVFAEKAEGSFLWDVEGRRYIGKRWRSCAPRLR